MAEAFNLNKFLNEYSTYNSKQYTAAENAKAAMEKREEEMVKEAVENNKGFLGITLSEKLSDLGVGKRVIKQLGDTAVNAVGKAVAPISDWLEKYEHIYDDKVYNAEMQALGKQHFYNMRAKAEAAADSPSGQNFDAFY